MKIGTVNHRAKDAPLVGDAIKAGLNPIVVTFDKLAGTDLAGCKGCEERKDWLNNHHEKLRAWLAAKKTET